MDVPRRRRAGCRSRSRLLQAPSLVPGRRRPLSRCALRRGRSIQSGYRSCARLGAGLPAPEEGRYVQDVSGLLRGGRRLLLLLRLGGGTLGPALVGEALIEARCYHGNAHPVTVVLVDNGAENQVRILVGRVVDDLRRLVYLEEPEVGAARDIQYDARRPIDGSLQQRTGDGGLRGLGSPGLAARLTDAHEGRTGVVHYRSHVGEVQVYEAGHRNEVGDALHTLPEDVVG